VAKRIRQVLLANAGMSAGTRCENSKREAASLCYENRTIWLKIRSKTWYKANRGCANKFMPWGMWFWRGNDSEQILTVRDVPAVAHGDKTCLPSISFKVR
jgi:hypothetical protein